MAILRSHQDSPVRPRQPKLRRAGDPEVTKVGCSRPDLLAATAFLFPSFTSIWPTAIRLGPLAVAWLVLVVSLLCPTGWAQQDVIVDVRVSGNRRIPADTIKARILPSRATFTMPPPWSVTSIPSGTPVISRTSASNASRPPRAGLSMSMSKNGRRLRKSSMWA